jgi:murein DD-endopeptidase MepM/ murein hydrolase activator NlpD
VKLLFTLLLVISVACGAQLKEKTWAKGETFLTFLESKKIPKELYFDLEGDDRELCSEINAGIKYYILEDEESKEMLQVLIPISEEMQIHLYKDKDKFVFSTAPVSYKEVTQTIAIPVANSPYQDIVEATSNEKLANEFVRSFTKLADFKRMQKGDHVAIKYTQRIRMGQYYGTPTIHAALVEAKNKQNYVFKNESDGRYYDQNARNLSSFFMKTPLNFVRVSDHFTQKRWHPVLKRYRAHLGIDYAAPSGRPIVAAANGKVTFKGIKGGYGQTIEISHDGNYKSLYAHMRGFANVKTGQLVKQGTVIGYVGSTGLSTGPHLHFGLYQNGQAINPASIIEVTTNQLEGKEKQQFLTYAKSLSKDLVQTIHNKPTPLKITKIAAYTTINNEV